MGSREGNPFLKKGVPLPNPPLPKNFNGSRWLKKAQPSS